VIIPPRLGVNQSQDEYQFNHWENTKGQETTIFSPEVHMLAGTLVPRCVDQHLVVRRLRGVARTLSAQLDTARTYLQVR
jgi:hypothetical protein